MAQPTHFEQTAGREETAQERVRTTPTLDDDRLDNDTHHNDDTAPLPILTEEGDAATAMSCDSPEEWAVGDIVDGRFVVQQRLGSGRFGPVFKALDRALSDPQIAVEHYVVLEELPPWVAERATFIERLEQLRLHPQSWSHPSIAKVLAFGRDGDRYFFCEELLEGASLRVVLEGSAPDALEEHEVLGILRYVGDALNYAHAKGIVHGDLRLDNVFVTDAYEVKLTGFLPSTEPRAEPLFVEDPSTGGQLHPSDDVYGLACLAYELLTRRHPYGGKPPLEALRVGLTVHPVLNLSPPRWQALSRGLALRRELRTATIPELLVGLGVTGDETLRPAPKNIEITAPPREGTPAETTPWPEIASPAPAPRTPRISAAPTVAPPRPEHFAAESAVDDFPRIYRDPTARHMRRRRGRRRGSTARAISTVVLAAGLATFAYFNYAWLRDRTAGFMETAAALVSQRSAAPAARPEAAAPTAAAPTPAAPTAAAPTTAPPTPAATAVAEPSAAPPAIEPPPAVSTSVPEPEPARATATSAPSDRPSPAQTAPPQPAEAAVAAAVTESPKFGFAEHTVTVNEGDSSVRVLIRRTGLLNEPASVVWWTADGTAVADEDYAVLGARVARFAVGADTQVLLVPLIADSVAEPRESFFIHLGAERAGGPPMQLEVVVLDDDR